MLKRIFTTSITLLLIAILGFYIWTYLPGETRGFVLQGTVEGLPEIDGEISNSLIQFEPNMRFNHDDLTYSIISECSEDKLIKMREAFSIIETEVDAISFSEVNSMDADILISCLRERIQEQPNTFITGEGGPSKFLNLSL